MTFFHSTEWNCAFGAFGDLLVRFYQFQYGHHFEKGNCMIPLTWFPEHLETFLVSFYQSNMALPPWFNEMKGYDFCRFFEGKKMSEVWLSHKENSLVGGGARTSLEIRIDCFVRVCYSLDWGGGEYKIECFYVIGLEKIWVDCPTQLICIWIFICVPWQS